MLTVLGEIDRYVVIFCGVTLRMLSGRVAKLYVLANEYTSRVFFERWLNNIFVY